MAGKSGQKKTSSPSGASKSSSSGKRGNSRQAAKRSRRGKQGKGGMPSILVLVLAAALFMAQAVLDIPVFDAVIPVFEQISGGVISEETSFPGEDPGVPDPADAPYIEYSGEIPEYSGSPYIEINGNIPMFTGEEDTTTSFEYYSPLDELGRCGVAFANIGTDLMPTEGRGSISSVKPAGWQTAKYDIVEGKYLYNRCHLIGFQLTGENANERNLITGTRYLNVDGMLPFENLVADYIKETGNHVLYRVTPLYEGDNLIADGLFMEGMSVEDDGSGVCFYIYAYNVQPGIEIDYQTGESRLEP